jgi:hypothetical protein
VATSCTGGRSSSRAASAGGTCRSRLSNASPGRGSFYGFARSEAASTHGPDIHLIGADAETSWLPPSIALDPKAYVLTGPDVRAAGQWGLDRNPFLLETSVPGIFAWGDVRCSPVKRVAAAVGEGSMAIAFAHQYLDETGGPWAEPEPNPHATDEGTSLPRRLVGRPDSKCVPHADNRRLFYDR